MSDITLNKTLNLLAEEIDIPDSSYDLVEGRYKALSAWFAAPLSKCSKFDPHLYVQGSFRLGTAIRPVNADGEYDLDMSCRLRTGITKQTFTQKQVKELVGADVEAYRVAQGCKVAGNSDPLVAANFDPPKSNRYPVWNTALSSKQEGGHDERQTDQRSPHDAAGRPAHPRHLPEGRRIA